MKFHNPFKIIIKEYSSDLNEVELKSAVETQFNLNPKRNMKSILVDEKSLYQGKINENSFKIEQNHKWNSFKDDHYFICTQIRGEISEVESKTKVKISAEISQKILYGLGFTILIYLLLIFFVGIIVGLASLIFLVGIFLLIRVQVWKDFVRFEVELINKLKLKKEKTHKL